MFDIPIDKSILVLGDGNFSFSKSWLQYLKIEKLDSTFITSVLQSQTECYEIYVDSQANSDFLRKLGVKIFFELDATRLTEDSRIEDRKFDAIIFNFPHNGGKTNRRKCRDLLRKIMLSCSKVMHDESRFYLSLAQGQSGLRRLRVTSNNGQSFENFEQVKDSWAAIYEASYADLILDRLIDFPADKLIENGYNCTGYKNKSRKFFVSDAQTLIFRKSEPIPLRWTLTHTETVLKRKNKPINPFLVHFSHDLSFWTDETFEEEDFFDKIYELSRGLIINMQILSEYRPSDGCEDGFSEAICCRLVWQSSRFALTKEICRDMQIRLRNVVDAFDFRSFRIKVK